MTTGATTRLGHLQPHVPKHGLVGCPLLPCLPRRGPIITVAAASTELYPAGIQHAAMLVQTAPLQYRAYLVLASMPGRWHALSTMAAWHALHMGGSRFASTRLGPSA